MTTRPTIAALSLALLACACHSTERGGTGTVHLAMAQASADVAGITYSVTCDDGTTWAAVVDLEEEGLPAHVSPEHQGWPFADLFFVTAAASCDVTATALDADGSPSAACEPASATLAVTPDVTTEAVLVISCGVDSAGADLVTLINQAPAVDVISVSPALVVAPCELVRVTPTVSDLDKDPVEVSFFIEAPDSGQLVSESVTDGELSFTPATPGTWTVTVTAADPWTATDASVDITVLEGDAPCVPQP